MATRTMHYLSTYLYLLALFMTISLSYSDDKVSYYKKLAIEDSDLCSVLNKRKIELNKSHTALLVTQTSTKYHRYEWNTNLKCVFKVDASDAGLFAVIRTINFRKNMETGECIDYVEFQGRDSTSRSRRFCGNQRLTVIPAGSPSSVPLDLNDLGFLDRRGKISTTIYISREPLPADMDMNLEIVFTSYDRCNGKYIGECLPGNRNYCIDSVYMTDGYVNCPFRDCGDELSCEVGYYTVDVHEESVSSTKVVISAIGSLAISFVLFIIVLGLCKKSHLICFSEECMNGSNNTSSRGMRDEVSRHNQTSRVIEMENRPEGDVAHNTRSPSAPEEDKDLPPSYESLFANR